MITAEGGLRSQLSAAQFAARLRVAHHEMVGSDALVEESPAFSRTIENCFLGGVAEPCVQSL